MKYIYIYIYIYIYKFKSLIGDNENIISGSNTAKISHNLQENHSFRFHMSRKEIFCWKF